MGRELPDAARPVIAFPAVVFMVTATSLCFLLSAAVSAILAAAAAAGCQYPFSAARAVFSAVVEPLISEVADVRRVATGPSAVVAKFAEGCVP